MPCHLKELSEKITLAQKFFRAELGGKKINIQENIHYNLVFIFKITETTTRNVCCSKVPEIITTYYV